MTDGFGLFPDAVWWKDDEWVGCMRKVLHDGALHLLFSMMNGEEQDAREWGVSYLQGVKIS